jgi:phosphatidylglycerol---prolipoprotein diacylglyceryl transferase
MVLNGHPISAFRALQWAGLVAGTIVAGAVGASSGLDANRVMAAQAALFFAGMIGAHVLYAIALGARDLDTLRFNARRRSAALWALPAALAVAAPAVVMLGLSPARFADAAAAGAVAATVLGRIGCLLRGCCGGRPSEARLAMTLVDAEGCRERRLPTQLLDAGWALVVVVGACLMVGHLEPGVTALLVTAAYCGGRILTDWTREGRKPPPRLRPMQYALAALLAIASTGIALSL